MQLHAKALVVGGSIGAAVGMVLKDQGSRPLMPLQRHASWYPQALTTRYVLPSHLVREAEKTPRRENSGKKVMH